MGATDRSLRVALAPYGITIGLLMTSADAGKSLVRVHGPPTLAHAIATMRFFAKRIGCQLQVREALDAVKLTDGNLQPKQPLFAEKGGVTIRAIPSCEQSWTLQVQEPRRASSSSEDGGSSGSRKRRRSSEALPHKFAPPTSNTEADAADYAAGLTRRPPLSAPLQAPSPLSVQRRVFDTAHDMFKSTSGFKSVPLNLDDPSVIPRGKSATAAWNIERLPKPVVQPSPMQGAEHFATQPFALSYAVTLPATAGKMDMEAAKVLGIRPGPHLGLLQKGKAVTVRRPARWSGMSDSEKVHWSQSKQPSSGGSSKKKAARPAENVVEEEAMEEVIIEPSQCVAPDVPGPVVLVIHVPTTGHLPSFLSEQNSSTLAAATKERGAVLMLHTSPLSVLQDERYQLFMKKWSQSETAHLLTAPELAMDNILYTSPTHCLRLLSKLDSRMFSVPPSTAQANMDVSSISACVSNVAKGLDMDEIMQLQPRLSALDRFRPGPSVVGGAPGLEADVQDDSESVRQEKSASPKVRTRRGSQGGGKAEVSSDAITNRKILQLKRAEDYQEYEAIARPIKEEVEASPASEQLVRKEWEDIDVITLGTGSAQPTKSRGLSATLVRLPSRFFKDPGKLAAAPDGGPSYGYVLLDAGEGTLGQLHQMYGKNSPLLRNILHNLRLIFISHIHADHCAGLVSVLRARYELGDAKSTLYLAAGRFTRQFVHEWNDIQPLNVLSEEQYGAVDADLSGKVVMLEAEHLDYQIGVGHIDSESPSRGDLAEHDHAYIAHLASGFAPGFTRWLKRYENSVLAQPAFSGLSRSDQAAQRKQINEAVWAAAVEEDPSLGTHRGMPAFAEAALTTKTPPPPNVREDFDAETSAFFRSNALKLYERTKVEERTRTRWALGLLQRDLGGPGAMWSVQTCEVDHRARHCYGLVLRLGAQASAGDQSIEVGTDSLNLSPPSNPSSSAGGAVPASFSLAYSGDTRPTPNLARAAANVNLLIHEATMQDEEAEMADMKGHSTIGGALRLARQAQCDVVLLTHFSQRYPKMPRLNLGPSGSPKASAKQREKRSGSPDDGEMIKENKKRPLVAIGMDLIRLGMNEMWKMEKYIPAMEVLFRADAVHGEEAEAEAEGGDVLEGQGEGVAAAAADVANGAAAEFEQGQGK